MKSSTIRNAYKLLADRASLRAELADLDGVTTATIDLLSDDGTTLASGIEVSAEWTAAIVESERVPIADQIAAIEQDLAALGVEIEPSEDATAEAEDADDECGEGCERGLPSGAQDEGCCG